tara:strand:+ start:266 stop:1843 length:1578 start_codon:yes stop_codon:yes gene_type:complete
MKKIILLSNNDKKSLEFIKYFQKDKNFQVSLVFLADDNVDLFREYNNIKFIKHSDLEKLNVRLFHNFRELTNEDLIENNFCKKTFLKMLDFHSFDKEQYTENEKNNLFEKTLNLVINLVEQVKPDLIVNLHIPHNYFEVMLAEVSEIRKIDHLFIRHFGLPNIYTVQSKLYSNSPLIQYYLNNEIFSERNLKVLNIIKNYEEIFKKEIKIEKKTNKWQNNYLLFLNTEKKINKLFFFLRTLFNLILNNFKVFLKIILAIFKLSKYRSVKDVYFSKEKLKVKNKNLNETINSNFNINYFSFKSDLKKYNLIESYNKISIDPKLSEKYIYFPTWYQPSASTYPFGGNFIEIIDVIKLLAKNKYNFKVYMKEHEDIFNLSSHAWVKGAYTRQNKVYEIISKIKNVSLINLKISESELMDNAIAIATQPSKNSLIALFRNKPVLMFGSSSLFGMQGLFKIENHEDLNITLKKILSENHVDYNKNTKFMDYLSQFSFLTDEMNSFNLDNTKSDYNDLLFILKKLIYSKKI